MKELKRYSLKLLADFKGDYTMNKEKLLTFGSIALGIVVVKLFGVVGVIVFIGLAMLGIRIYEKIKK